MTLWIYKIATHLFSMVRIWGALFYISRNAIFMFWTIKGDTNYLLFIRTNKINLAAIRRLNVHMFNRIHVSRCWVFHTLYTLSMFFTNTSCLLSGIIIHGKKESSIAAV